MPSNACADGCTINHSPYTRADSTTNGISNICCTNARPYGVADGTDSSANGHAVSCAIICTNPSSVLGRICRRCGLRFIRLDTLISQLCSWKCRRAHLPQCMWYVWDLSGSIGWSNGSTVCVAIRGSISFSCCFADGFADETTNGFPCRCSDRAANVVTDGRANTGTHSRTDRGAISLTHISANWSTNGTQLLRHVGRGRVCGAVQFGVPWYAYTRKQPYNRCLYS